MILYLDTSSLVKVYVHEEGSDEVRRLFVAATTVVTSVVAYAEARAAFAHQRRARALTAPAFAEAKRLFEQDWVSVIAVGLSEAVVRAAGELAERHGIRGFDSIHLASFQQLLERAGEEDVHFSTFDDRHARAARRLGSRLLGACGGRHRARSRQRPPTACRNRPVTR